MTWTTLTALESLAPNALTSRSDAAEGLRGIATTLAPQRWEFFTASPQARQYVALDPSTLSSAMSLPQSRQANMFGLSRAQRAEGPEVAALHQAVSKWTRCSDRSNPRPCLERLGASAPEELTNRSARQLLCGDLLLAQLKPTPFEFRRFDLPDFSVIRAAHVEVSCN